MLLTIFKIILIIIVLVVAFIFMFVIIKGKGKPVKLVDEKGKAYPNGISTREKILIGGKEQYIFMVGEIKDNPILLFLHGGPGSPEIAMNNFDPGERLEERFTVCYWEQRGAGLSYNARLEADQMTLDLMINDTIELTEYLIGKYGQKQIYIMGHSWGTFLGVHVINTKPEYYKAYFGIGQVADQINSEKNAYDYMLKHANETNDTQAINELNKFDKMSNDFPSVKYIMSYRTKYMDKYGIGIRHIENYNISEILKQVLFFRGYSALDIMKFAMGSLFSIESIFHLVLEENLIDTQNKFEIPVYIFHGKHDQQVSYDIAKQYFGNISAPQKEFYAFDNSAHSPNFEETHKFLEIVFSIQDEIEKN